MTSLEISQLKPFGATLTNVNLDSPEQREQIHQLLHQHGVVIIPGSGSFNNHPIDSDTDERLIQLAELFGTVESSHSKIENSQAINTNQDTESTSNVTPLDKFKQFQSNMSWRVDPPLVNMLCGKTVPSNEGKICFQNTHRMYNNLSPTLRESLHHLNAVHSLKPTYIRVDQPGDLQKDVQSIHPAVIKHPNTGAPLLYLNPSSTIALMGLDEQESTKLLNHIFEEAIQSEQILVHIWEEGDVVLWDNLGVQSLVQPKNQNFRTLYQIAASTPYFRTDRFVGNADNLNQALSNIEHYLKQDDNRAGYEQWAAQYEQDINQAGYKIPRIATDTLAKHLNDRGMNNAVKPRILDIAAGTGKNALHLMQNHSFTNIEAMDISSGMLFEAHRRELYNAYHVGDANKPLSIGSDQYDAILCIGGLSANQIHAKPALEEFIRITKKGGLVVMSMREAEQDYIDEVNRLITIGVAKVVDDFSFSGIESNKNLLHHLYVLQACNHHFS